MSTRAEIEQRLRVARPSVDTPPPPISAILARIEREPAREAREAKRRRRWRRSRAVIPAALAAAVLAGAGGGALLLTSGRPVPPAFLLPASPQTGLGQPIPASLALLPMRVPDPGGGPPWGMRVIRTTRGLVCLQAGRVVEGRLGGLGSGSAFGGDGLFHPFMAADAIGVDACPTADGEGLAFMPGPPTIVTANGLPLAGENLWPGERVHCDLPGQENWGVRCPQSELRQVAMGLLGPDVTSIRVSSPEGESTVEPYGPEGAYLIVLPAQPNANISMVSRASGGAALTVTYNDGSQCQLPARSPQQQCKPAGFPTSAPLPSTAEVSAPVSVRYVPLVSHPTGPLIADARTSDHSRTRRFPGDRHVAGGPGPGPALTISFQAPIAAENESSGYVVELRPREVPGCATPSLIVSQPTAETIKAGETVEITVPLDDSCATTYAGRVFYARSTPDRVAGTSDSEDEGPLYEVVGSQFGAAQRALTFPTVGSFQVAVPGA